MDNKEIPTDLAFKVFSILNTIFGTRTHIYRSEVEGKGFDGLLQVIQENYGVRGCTREILKALLPIFLETWENVQNKVTESWTTAHAI